MPTHADLTEATDASARPPDALTRSQHLVWGALQGYFKLPAWVVLVELFIGLGWIRAAIEKVLDPMWWSGAALSDFITGHAELTLPWYQGFLDAAIVPNAVPISIVVMLTQALVGVSLVTGRRVATGLAAGMFLNLNFIASGAVDPSIFYLICQGAILLWMSQTPDRFGLDRKLLRWIPSASLVLFLVNVPFVSTLDPQAVVEDPAMILAFFGLLMAASSRLALHQTPPGD